MASEPLSLIVEKARKSLGLHELFIPSVAASGEQHQYEAGLTNIECKKNPGHPTFIPWDKFTLEHLPPGYQDELYFDYVNNTAYLTGLLTVKHVSEDRPETYPGTQDPYPCGDVRGNDLIQYGTGLVLWVEPKFYTQEDGVSCPCGVCAVSDTPSSTWGKFYVITATHVVFDSMEARSSDMRLFYMSGGKWDQQVKVVNGVKVEDSDIGRDWCYVMYVTHEEVVYDTLRSTRERWLDLRQKVVYKYRYNNNKPVVGEPAIIISHPHASHQHITVGKLTHIEVDDEDPDYNRVTYSTDTCPGSSGAAVILPGRSGVLWDYHPHSRACPHGQPGNQSAFGWWFC